MVPPRTGQVHAGNLLLRRGTMSIISPTTAPSHRVPRSFACRTQAAGHDAFVPPAAQIDNGDEALYPDKSGTYTKGILQTGEERRPGGFRKDRAGRAAHAQWPAGRSGVRSGMSRLQPIRRTGGASPGERGLGSGTGGTILGLALAGRALYSLLLRSDGRGGGNGIVVAARLQ